MELLRPELSQHPPAGGLAWDPALSWGLWLRLGPFLEHPPCSAHLGRTLGTEGPCGRWTALGSLSVIGWGQGPGLNRPLARHGVPCPGRGAAVPQTLGLGAVCGLAGSWAWCRWPRPQPAPSRGGQTVRGWAETWELSAPRPPHGGPAPSSSLRCPLKTLQKCEIALEKLKNDMAVVSGLLCLALFVGSWASLVVRDHHGLTTSWSLQSEGAGAIPSAVG